MPTTEELVRMKDKIDKAGLEKARLDGSLAEKMKQLETLGFTTTDDAEKALMLMREQLAALEEKVQDGVKELHEKYGL